LLWTWWHCEGSRMGGRMGENGRGWIFDLASITLIGEGRGHVFVLMDTGVLFGSMLMMSIYHFYTIRYGGIY
jgi:hypothetical protein